jgi:DNA mismatch repair ATPase MutS
MSFTQNEDKTGDASAVTFLYRMVPGVAPSSFGLNVAALAGIPEDLLRCASAKSRVLRATTELRRQRLDSLRRLFELLFSSGIWLLLLLDLHRALALTQDIRR